MSHVQVGAAAHKDACTADTLEWLVVHWFHWISCMVHGKIIDWAGIYENGSHCCLFNNIYQQIHCYYGELVEGSEVCTVTKYYPDQSKSYSFCLNLLDWGLRSVGLHSVLMLYINSPWDQAYHESESNRGVELLNPNGVVNFTWCQAFHHNQIPTNGCWVLIECGKYSCLG